MSDAGRLLAAFETGTLLRPATDEPSTVDLALALAHLCGVDDCTLTPAADRIADLIGPARHIVFVLIDGFGMNFVEREPESSVLRANVAMELRAVFPSSTAPALTSLATGLWPSDHAVPGWWTHLPAANLTATILPLLERFSEQPLAGRVTPAQAYPAPTMTGAYKRATLRVTTALVNGSVYSQYSTPAAASFGYRSLRFAIDRIDQHIAGADGDTYTYFYIPYVDTAAHTHGGEAAQVRRVTKRVRERVTALARTLRGRARVVISADHGQVTINERGRHIIDRNDELMRHLLVPPTCEPRAAAFHVRPGHLEEFAAHFRSRFGERFALLATDEVDHLRLLGRTPVAEETRRRLGDCMAIALDRDVLLYEPSNTLRAMKGFHGGLLPEETRIPLMVL